MSKDAKAALSLDPQSNLKKLEVCTTVATTLQRTVMSSVCQLCVVSSRRTSFCTAPASP